MPQDQKSIQQPERDRGDHEQIHRSDAVRVISKKRLPSLGWRAPSSRHVLGNGGLPSSEALMKFRQSAAANSHTILLAVPGAIGPGASGTIGRGKALVPASERTGKGNREGDTTRLLPRAALLAPKGCHGQDYGDGRRKCRLACLRA